MSKGKYKRKKQNAQERAQQGNQVITEFDGNEQPVKAQNPTQREEQTNNKKGHPVNSYERFKFESMRVIRFLFRTNRLIAIFTAALVGTGVYQFTIMKGQLRQMRNEQRPWIELKIVPDPQIYLTNTIQLVNEGKAPARNVTVDAVVDIVTNGEEPKLDFPLPHFRAWYGLLFSNNPTVPNPLSRLQPDVHGGVEPFPATAAESESLKKLESFEVVYGIVTYTDFSNIQHWTKFCQPVITLGVGPPAKPGVTFQKCTTYNDVDGN